MPKFVAKNAEVAIAINGGAYTDVSDSFNSIEIGDANDAQEVTNFASGGNYEGLDGLNNADFSASGFYSSDDHATLISAKTADTRSVRIRPQGTGVGKPQIVVNLVGMSVGASFGVGDASGMDVSATVTGAPNYTAQ